MRRSATAAGGCGGIDANQDPRGLPMKAVRRDDGVEVYAKPLTGRWKSLLSCSGIETNRSSRVSCRGGHIIGSTDDDMGISTKTTRTISVTWAELGLEAGRSMQVRDLWAKKDIGEFTGSFSAEVQFHEALIFAFEES